MPAMKERHMPFPAADAAGDFPLFWTGSGVVSRAEAVVTEMERGNYCYSVFYGKAVKFIAF